MNALTYFFIFTLVQTSITFPTGNVSNNEEVQEIARLAVTDASAITEEEHLQNVEATTELPQSIQLKTNDGTGGAINTFFPVNVSGHEVKRAQQVAVRVFAPGTSPVAITNSFSAGKGGVASSGTGVRLAKEEKSAAADAS